MTHYAKFSSQQFEVTPLHIGKVQFFQGQGEIEKITKHNGHGEEDKFVYTVRPKFIDWSEADSELSTKEHKSVENFSKSMSPSQKLRWWIEKRWEANGSIGDMESYYQKIMSELIQNQQDLAEEER